MIETKFRTLHLCEVKFSREKIGMEVIEQVQEKINRLHIAKNFSIWPVLIHVNGVTESVMESGFFSKILDFGDLFLR